MSISAMRNSKRKNKRSSYAQSQEESLYNDTQLTDSEKVSILLSENAETLLLPYLDEAGSKKLSCGKYFIHPIWLITAYVSVSSTWEGIVQS